MLATQRDGDEACCGSAPHCSHTLLDKQAAWPHATLYWRSIFVVDDPERQQLRVVPSNDLVGGGVSARAGLVLVGAQYTGGFGPDRHEVGVHGR